MNQDDKDADPTKPVDTLARYLIFAIPLATIASVVTLGTAYWSAPNNHITVVSCFVWTGIPLFLYFAFSTQNTIEGCVMTGMIMALLFIGGAFLPLHIKIPAIAAIVTSLVVTRVHRRYC